MDNEGNGTRRMERNRSVIPVQCVHLISEYLIWKDLSKKGAVPIIINNSSFDFILTLSIEE